MTKEECYIATGDNVEELKKWVEERKKKQEAEAAKTAAATAGVQQAGSVSTVPPAVPSAAQK